MIKRLSVRAVRFFSTKGKRGISVSPHNMIEQTLESLANEGIYSQISSEAIRLDRLAMTPHQYWVAKGRGMEVPFTGEYWFNQEVGMYKCRVCKNSLFGFDDKFKSETGMASFWNHQSNSLELMEVLPSEPKESRQVCCAECKSHVGRVHFDGPPPTFIRYEVNSAALQFELKAFFEDPADIADKKKAYYMETKNKSRRDFLKEYKDNNDDIQNK